MTARIVAFTIFAAIVGCGAAQAVCPIIKIADDACPLVLEVANPDGGAPTQVTVSPAEARQFAETVRAAHAAKMIGKDAGQ